MRQNTQVFMHDTSSEIPGDELEYIDSYGTEEYGYTGYGDEGGYEGHDGEYDLEPDIPEEDYAVYNEEPDNAHRFHVAMNAFNLASVFAGVVAIFALTALIITLVSWIQTDISNSFVLLQSGIQ